MSNLQLAVITDEISNDLVFAGASVGSGVVQLYHQLQKDNSRTKKYRGFFSSAATIYREEGIYAFFKGYFTRFLIVIFGGLGQSITEVFVRPILLTKEEIEAENMQLNCVDVIDQKPGETIPKVVNSLQLKTTSYKIRKQIVRIIATTGGVAVKYPLDTIRVNLMAQQHKSKYAGIIDCFNKLTVMGEQSSRYALSPFYRGLSSFVVATVTYRIVSDSVDVLIRKLENENNKGKFLVQASHALAPLAGCLVAYPFVLIQHRMQVGDDYGGQGLINILQTIIREEGYRGLYKGFLFF